MLVLKNNKIMGKLQELESLTERNKKLIEHYKEFEEFFKPVSNDLLDYLKNVVIL